jgi:hypothetical protein
MPKRTSHKIPKGAVVVRTYRDFYTEIDAFEHGERNLLIVVGPPGTSKSTAARQRLKDARTIQGGSTPYRLYQELFEHRDRPVVLDDADKVFRNRDGVFLLKLLTQTERTKTLQWNSTTPEIRRGDLPAEFGTTSRTMIVANSWPSDDPDIAAVESRGHLLYFAPSFQEMHRFAGAFGLDPEVYGFIGEHLPYFDRLDLRLYFKAGEVKATGVRTGQPGVWQEYVRRQIMDAEKRVALDLLSDGNFGSDNVRSKEFSRITGMSPRAFYRYRDDIALRHEQAACAATRVKPANRSGLPV